MSDETIGPFDAAELIRQPWGTTEQSGGRFADYLVPPDIPPALSAEEWRAANIFDGGGLSIHGDYYAIENDSLHISYTREIGRCFEASELPRLIALANAALPDNDPRKITQADVETVIDGALQATDEFPFDPQAMALEAKLRSVAAKLAALLPHT